MSDDKPRHEEIIVEAGYPATIRRRRWCGHCHIWTWEVGWLNSDIWRHGRGARTQKCKEASAEPEPPR